MNGFQAEGLIITFLLKYLLRVIIEKMMKQHFGKNSIEENSAHDTAQLFSFLHIRFLLLISEVPRTDRDSTLLVRNEFMVSVKKKLPT